MPMLTLLSTMWQQERALNELLTLNKEKNYNVSAVTRDNDKGHLQLLIRGEEKEFVIVDTVT